MTTVRRPKDKRLVGVYRRCSCPERSDKCEHWSFSIEVPGKGGKRRQISRSGFRNASEASEERGKLIAKHREGTLPTDDKITVGEWVRKWLDARIAADELRPSTARSYKDLAEQHLLPKVGDVRLAKLRPADLTSAYREIVADRNVKRAEVEARNAKWLERNPGSTRPYASPRPIGPTTIRRVHAVASGALTAARKGGLISVNPAPDAELPKVSKDKVAAWTPEQYAAFLAAVRSDRHYAAFHLVGHTGLRRGEVAGLTWGEVDLQSGRLTVRQTRVSVGYRIHEGKAKSAAGQGRTVPLDSGTVEILRFHRKRQQAEQMAAGPAYEDGGWLVCDELGRPLHPERISKTFKRLAARAGLPETKLHGLRHFFVAAMISSGQDISVVSKLAGHSSIQVTADVYGSLFDTAARDVTEGVAALVRGAAREAR
jgi:integrase